MRGLSVYVVCNLTVGVSLALPLFLFFRERKRNAEGGAWLSAVLFLSIVDSLRRQQRTKCWRHQFMEDFVHPIRRIGHVAIQPPLQ